jgi:DNA-binding beta-propeller fold protein YncE
LTRSATALAALLAASAAAEPLPLPGGEGIGLDDLRFSAELHRLLVPAGRTGRPALELRPRSVPAGPESLVVDAANGRAYTNTFKDATVAIDVRAHAVTATWPNGCGGARGIALDPTRGLLFVGCDEGKAVALDASHGGQIVGTAKTGDGVDSIAYSPQLSHLYVPAADAARLSILGVGEHGELQPLGTIPAAPGAHCAAADDLSQIWVCDPRNGRLLATPDPFPPSR